MVILTVIVVILSFIIALNNQSQPTIYGAQGIILDNGFQLATREELTKFYEAQFEHFYNNIPNDILQKRATTIEKVDKKIEKEKIAGMIISKSSKFDLGYYAHIIKIGISPYIDKNDLFSKELRDLTNNIDTYTIDYERLNKHNKLLYGNEMPAPTIFRGNLERTTIKTAINGNDYNITDAINYAHTWTENNIITRNPDYNYYAGLNDCTNFISQVLNAGGLSYIHNDSWGLDFNDPDNWYYSNNGWPDRPSLTWGGAQNLYDHLASYISNIRRVYSTLDLQVGDIVMWDTEPNDETFHISHSTVITKIQNGTIYVTYHSTDREDEPLSTLSNAGYLAYGWAINH